MERDERIRLFCALRLPDEWLDGVVAWQRSALPDRPGVRPVRRGNLHVTLAFLGSRPAAERTEIAAALRAAAGTVEAAPRLSVGRYLETRSVGLLVLADEGGVAAAIASDLQERLERLGVYRREGRPWLPHLTVVRFRERPRLRVEPPALPPVAPSGAAVYMSRLRPDGAQYEVLDFVALQS